MDNTTTRRRATARAGRRASARLVWYSRTASAAFLVGVLFLGFAAIRPLPTPPAPAAAAPINIPPVYAQRSDLALREQLLTGLIATGNVFAPDREPWPDTIAELPEPEPETTAAAPAPAPLPGTGATPAVEEIQLTAMPTAAAARSLDGLTLRGLMVSGGRRLAMIEGGTPRQRTAVDLYREGQVFSAETWKILKIDDRHDRVIIEHLGQGDVLELTLYDSAPAVAQTPVSAAPVVEPSSAAQARQELIDAGIDAGDVAGVFDILAALQEGKTPPAPTEEPHAARTQAGTAPPPDTTTTTPELPPGFADLLRSMMADAARSRPPEKKDQ